MALTAERKTRRARTRQSVRTVTSRYIHQRQYIPCHRAGTNAILFQRVGIGHRAGTGQKALAYALLYPEKTVGGRGHKAPINGQFAEIHRGRISDARLIREICPDDIEAIKQGDVPWR